MNENELKVLKMNLLGGMNDYILNGIQDEDYHTIWLTLGVPDEATEEDLESIAEDAEEFAEIVHLFDSIVRNDYRNNS